MQKPTTVTAQLQAWPRSSRDEGKQKVISEMHAEGFDTHKVAGAQRILCQLDLTRAAFMTAKDAKPCV